MTRASDCQVRTVSFVIITLATDPKLSILHKKYMVNIERQFQPQGLVCCAIKL